jgi:WD40 repeat protein
MKCQKLLQQMIGVTLVMLFLVGCSTPAATLVPPMATPAPPTPTPVPPTATPTLTPAPTPTIDRFAHLSGLILLADHDRGNTLLAVAADGISEERFEINSNGDFASSPDSATILHALNGAIYKVNLSTGTESLIVDMGDSHDINNLNFSPDGERLAFTDYGTLYVMELADGQEHQVYSSLEDSYMGGLKAACEIQYLTWADGSRLIFYSGTKLPGAIVGNSERRTVPCDDRVWHEVDPGTGKEQRLDRVSSFSEEFQRQLEDRHDQWCQPSPNGQKLVCDDWIADTTAIVESDGQVYNLDGRMSSFTWSVDGSYIVGVPRGTDSLWLVPADLSEPPIKFHDCRCTPLLWLPADPSR